VIVLGTQKVNGNVRYCIGGDRTFSSSTTPSPRADIEFTSSPKCMALALPYNKRIPTPILGSLKKMASIAMPSGNTLHRNFTYSRDNGCESPKAMMTQVLDNGLRQQAISLGRATLRETCGVCGLTICPHSILGFPPVYPRRSCTLPHPRLLLHPRPRRQQPATRLSPPSPSRTAFLADGIADADFLGKDEQFQAHTRRDHRRHCLCGCPQSYQGMHSARCFPIPSRSIVLASICLPMQM
jgi:hypothetical protein